MKITKSPYLYGAWQVKVSETDTHYFWSEAAATEFVADYKYNATLLNPAFLLI